MSQRNRDIQPELELESLKRQISVPDGTLENQARQRVDQLTKPPGSLGLLEEMAIRLAGIVGEPIPNLGKKAVVVCCGDHGVVEEGVTAYPSEVTEKMMANFAAGGAAINVISRQVGADVCVVDVGSKAKSVPDGVIDCRVRLGTDNLASGPAMSRDEAVRAVMIGVDMARRLKRDGVRVIAVGEMGIGNTTPATAIAAVMTGHPVDRLTGRGAGVDDEGLLRKVRVIERAIRINRPDPQDPLDVLAKVGGLEIGAMAGVMLGGALERMPVVIDGHISTSAALIAVGMAERVRKYLFASHLSEEPAHRMILEALGLKPLLHARMRLGEGTGAALLFPLMETAVALMREMATFADLGLEGP